ncbi:hypothetical protein, partial sequence, partial [Candidatus Phytoplasma solani]
AIHIFYKGASPIKPVIRTQPIKTRSINTMFKRYRDRIGFIPEYELLILPETSLQTKEELIKHFLFNVLSSKLRPSRYLYTFSKKICYSETENQSISSYRNSFDYYLNPLRSYTYQETGLPFFHQYFEYDIQWYNHLKKYIPDPFKYLTNSSNPKTLLNDIGHYIEKTLEFQPEPKNDWKNPNPPQLIEVVLTQKPHFQKPQDLINDYLIKNHVINNPLAEIKEHCYNAITTSPVCFSYRNDTSYCKDFYCLYFSNGNRMPINDISISDLLHNETNTSQVYAFKIIPYSNEPKAHDIFISNQNDIQEILKTFKPHNQYRHLSFERINLQTAPSGLLAVYAIPRLVLYRNDEQFLHYSQKRNYNFDEILRNNSPFEEVVIFWNVNNFPRTFEPKIHLIEQDIYADQDKTKAIDNWLTSNNIISQFITIKLGCYNTFSTTIPCFSFPDKKTHGEYKYSVATKRLFKQIHFTSDGTRFNYIDEYDPITQKLIKRIFFQEDGQTIKKTETYDTIPDNFYIPGVTFKYFTNQPDGTTTLELIDHTIGNQVQKINYKNQEKTINSIKKYLETNGKLLKKSHYKSDNKTIVRIDVHIDFTDKLLKQIQYEPDEILPTVDNQHSIFEQITKNNSQHNTKKFEFEDKHINSSIRKKTTYSHKAIPQGYGEYNVTGNYRFLSYDLGINNSFQPTSSYNSHTIDAIYFD